MKRKKTKTSWIHSVGWLARKAMRSPSQLIVPSHEPPRKSQMIVMKIAENVKNRNQKRQNHARRRLTTSSSRSSRLSVPKRLGHGMLRLKIRSTRPRKPITRKNVAISDSRMLQPCTWWNQKKTAGLVRSGDEGGGAAEALPLLGEHGLLVGAGERSDGLRGLGHRDSVDGCA